MFTSTIPTSCDQDPAMPTAWDDTISARLMPTRYTSRKLVKLAEEFGRRLLGVTRDHYNFKPGEPVHSIIVHPRRDAPEGRAVDKVKKIGAQQ